MEITDSADRTIRYFTYDLASGEVSGAVVLKVTAQDGRQFKAGSSSLLLLEARETGSSDPFASLHAGIGLSGFTPGEQVQFDVRATGLSVTGRARGKVFLGVVDSPGAADWVD